MERFVKGDIVIVPFPFSDLTQAKRRPALVIANPVGNDLILCPVTTKNKKDTYAISLNSDDFSSGALKHSGYIRANILFTAEIKIILKRVGNLNKDKLTEVVDKVVAIIQK
ncbi:MAG: type II toxin-antitoxin system PemK/MazF family toxin [Nitrospinales bacterium]